MFINKKELYEKSALTLAALATLGVCVSLCNGAQHKTNLLIQDKKESFHSFASQIGFNIPEYYVPVHVTNQVESNGWHFDEYRYYEAGKLNHYSQVYDALLKSTCDDDVYLYCYKITLDPHQVRDYGFLGIGSSGDNWALYSLKTIVNFQKTISFGPQNTPEYEILNFAPKNHPSQWSQTIGFDVGISPSGVSSSVSASVNFNYSELSVESGTSAGIPVYKTLYSFKPINGNIYTSYLLRTEYCYGMVLFRYRYNVKLTISHDIQYAGTAWNWYGDAGKVHFGYNLIY